MTNENAAITKGRKTILFLCTHNSARSQMAEGWMRHLTDGKYDVHSAGTVPSKVNPLAIEAMGEKGVDISGHTSKGAETFLDRGIDLVITVCDSAKENCPFFPGAKEYVHKSFPDPKNIEEFREVRDMIEEWIGRVLIPEIEK
ncbi:MAG: arsenate reductase ArsC [Candidatus Thermoplasmatota archaeon]|nr:arsenate reductase ArsC [Candidatus Thermoplasmatota archaeon]